MTINPDLIRILTVDDHPLLRKGIAALVNSELDMNGTEAIERILAEFPEARIIVLTTYSGDAQVLRALRVGAKAYILKAQVHRELLDTIRAVHGGQKRIPADLALP
jgi:DNA-binding NarL/FixJ family response regulator